MLYYGRAVLHMSTDDILDTRYGEMIDLINCHAIYTGAADPKHENKLRRVSLMEALAMS